MADLPKPKLVKTKPAKFKPVNKLEKLFAKAARRSSKATQKFYEELIVSEIYVIPQNRPAIRGGMAAPGEVLKLLGYAVNDVFFIAFFTSEERVLEANAGGMGFLKMAAADFFAITKGSYLVLNPNSALGRDFFPAEIEQVIASKPDRSDNKNVD